MLAYKTVQEAASTLEEEPGSPLEALIGPPCSLLRLVAVLCAELHRLSCHHFTLSRCCVLYSGKRATLELTNKDSLQTLSCLSYCTNRKSRSRRSRRRKRKRGRWRRNRRRTALELTNKDLLQTLSSFLAAPIGREGAGRGGEGGERSKDTRSLIRST